MTTAVQKHVSQSIAQATSVLERRWNGLCVASCLELSWSLSMENLGAVKASLLSIYAQQSPVGSNGERAALSEAEWSMFARKVLADLRRDSKRMLMQTRWSWLNFLQSSLTRRIYWNRKMRQRSLSRSSVGQKKGGQ